MPLMRAAHKGCLDQSQAGQATGRGRHLLLETPCCSAHFGRLRLRSVGYFEAEGDACEVYDQDEDGLMYVMKFV